MIEFCPQTDVNSLPPQNIDAEESILGGILLDPEALALLEHILVPEAFYIEAHRQIYRAAKELYRKQQPTDLMTVTTWLDDRGLLEKVGGTSKLAQLVSRTISAVNIDRYAELVMDKYQRRQLISAGHQIAELAYNTSIELDKVLDCCEQKVFSISSCRSMSTTEDNAQIAIDAYNRLQENIKIYRTGIEALDNRDFGLESGTLNILAGRPSMGKSYAASFIALEVARSYGLPVLYFSLEMNKEQLQHRQWSLISVLDCYKYLGLLAIESNRIRRHRKGTEPLKKLEIDTIAKIVEIACSLPIHINDAPSITVSQIASECRQITAKKGKLGLVIVDYIQMMRASQKRENRAYELEDITIRLREIAKELKVPVLALSQVSRAVETRQNKRPTMADLSQSGGLETVADNIIFLYRDEYYNRQTEEEGVLELNLAKARHGETGTAKVLFDKRYGIISSADQ